MWVRVPPSPMTNVSDFQRESFRIDEQIWDAIGLRAGERALFCGIANDGAWIARAVEIGVDVSVIAGDDATIGRVTQLGATPLRGSATMIPAREKAYDASVAFHYLHEVDPGFHAQIVAELARVANRIVIVEPSPPADPLGRRIAALYGRAKREAGQFEQYQPIEYWRKLLAAVKADVWQSLFTFTRVPPRHAVAETVSLILSAMAIEDLPSPYLAELRALAARPDAQLLPLSRIVLVATPAGEPLPHSDTRFRPDAQIAPAPPPAREPFAARSPAPPPPPPTPPQPTTPSQPVFRFALSGPAEAPQMPPGPPPPPSSPAPAPQLPRTPEAPAAAPFGVPFAVPESGDGGEMPFGVAAANAEEPAGGFGWTWEPPESEAADEPPEP